MKHLSNALKISILTTMSLVLVNCGNKADFSTASTSSESSLGSPDTPRPIDPTVPVIPEPTDPTPGVDPDDFEISNICVLIATGTEGFVNAPFKAVADSASCATWARAWAFSSYNGGGKQYLNGTVLTEPGVGFNTITPYFVPKAQAKQIFQKITDSGGTTGFFMGGQLRQEVLALQLPAAGPEIVGWEIMLQYNGY